MTTDQQPEDAWRLWIDTGGTFTDCLGIDSRGRPVRLKVLSSSRLRAHRAGGEGRRALLSLPVDGAGDLYAGYRIGVVGRPHQSAKVLHSSDGTWLDLDRSLAGDHLELISPEEAPAFASRLLTRTPLAGKLPHIVLRLATTKGTNALLERAGCRVGLVVTSGFGDLLVIGNQARPDIFALNIQRPTPFYEAVVEVGERLSADGSVLVPLDEASLRAKLEALRGSGVQAIAVALLHSYRNPIHELVVERVAAQVGFTEISLSSALAPVAKIVPRAETAVIDAYLAKTLSGYLDGISNSLGGETGERARKSRLRIMTSAGGLVAREKYRPKDSLLSGPAGGVVGAATAGAEQQWQRLLTFDMGGTSTDVARFDGDYEYRYEQRVGDATVVAPALAIETVAAGGGSLCWLDEDLLRVGPRSAGAQPGPACYGAGGPLAITDVNLLLGRVVEDQFEIPLDLEASRAAAEDVRKRLSGIDLEEVLFGFLQIANERMADAMRRVSVRKGFDPKTYSMVSFGGAGGQHACGVANELGVRRILVPRDASLLSALGLGRARIERFAQKQLLELLSTVADDLGAIFERLDLEALSGLDAELDKSESAEVRRRTAEVRYRGQDSGLEVNWQGVAERIQPDFEDAYRKVFGYLPRGRELEVVSLRVVASSDVTEMSQRADPALRQRGAAREPARTPVRRRAFFEGRWQEVACFDRDSVGSTAIEGPALLVERHSVTVVEPGWSARPAQAGGLILER